MIGNKDIFSSSIFILCKQYERYFLNLEYFQGAKGQLGQKDLSISSLNKPFYNEGRQ